MSSMQPDMSGHERCDLGLPPAGGQLLPQMDGVPIPLEEIAAATMAQKRINLEEAEGPSSQPSFEMSRHSSNNRPGQQLPAATAAVVGEPSTSGPLAGMGHIRNTNHMHEDRDMLMRGRGGHRTLEPMVGPGLVGIRMADVAAHAVAAGGGGAKECAHGHAHGRELLGKTLRSLPPSLLMRDT